MPNRDHTGPKGQGAMTGRKTGECSNNETNSTAPRLGQNRRLGHGKGNNQDNKQGNGRRRR